MAPRMLRLGLSFIVGLGCWFGQIQAKEPPLTPVPAPAVAATPATAELATGHARAHVASRILHPFASLRERSDLDDRARAAFNRHGYCCGQHHNWYGCGGWHAQNVFVFGSCRTFFGEPCLPNGSGEKLFSPGAPANVPRWLGQ
jgi:hypothetical protein